MTDELKRMRDEMNPYTNEINPYDQLRPSSFSWNLGFAAAVELLTKWKPIETAPKDVSRLLGFDGNYVQMFYWNRFSQNWTSAFVSEPTHWLPLPSPPEAPK